MPNWDESCCLHFGAMGENAATDVTITESQQEEQALMRPKAWAEDYDPKYLLRSGCMGQPQPKGLKGRSTAQFVEHGGGTRAQWSSSIPYYYRALRDLLVLPSNAWCGRNHTNVQSGRWNAMILFGMYGYVCTMLSGTNFRIFSRNSFLTPLICVTSALILGLYAGMCDGAYPWQPVATGGSIEVQVSTFLKSSTCPEEIIFANLASNFQSLTNFTLGLYVSLVLSRIYYAQRGMLGGSFGGILGFCMRLLSSMKPPKWDPEGPHAPVLPPRAKKAQKQLVRWANAIFRLLWLESCEYESQMNQDIAVMDGNLGPLLTESEWARIKDVPSRVTHIIYWINTSVDDLRRAGYFDEMTATALANQLNEVRSSNNFGLSSLPYPYVYVITSMTKLMILFKTVEKAFQMSLIQSGKEFFENKDSGSNSDFEFKITMGFFLLFQLMAEAWMYQALLELYIVLRNPNQGKLAGHMPTPDFLQFTEAVTAGMLSQQDTTPRAMYEDRDVPADDVEANSSARLERKASDWIDQTRDIGAAAV